MIILWVMLSSLGAYAAISTYLESMTSSWTPPSKRKGSSILLFTVDDSRSLIIFGGVSFEKKYNDVWLFREYAYFWERIELPYGTIMSNLYLGPRSEALILLYKPSQVNLIIFGGKDEYGFNTEIWTYDFNLRFIEKKKDFNEIKGLADYASCGTNENLIYVYGGRTYSKFSTELWKINIEDMTIQSFPQNETTQRIVLNGKIFVYNNEVYSFWTSNEFDIIDPNIYKYSFESLTWIKLNSSLQKFQPSFQPEIFIFSDFLFVYGGLRPNKSVMNRILRANLASDQIIFEEVNIQDYKVKFKPAISLDEKYSKVFIFGGLINDITNQIDIAIIDINANTFNAFTAISNLEYPQERVFNTLHLIDSKIAMFGGNNNGKFYNDLWLFDTIGGNWTALEGKGKIPSIRTSHAASSEGDTLIIWGGEDAQGFRNDMFLYNFITAVWYEIKPKNLGPSSRIGACGALSFPKFYILGGLTYSGTSNEIWEYDFNTKLYTKLLSSNLNFYGGQCQLLKNKIYVLAAKDENYLGFNSVPYFDITENTFGSIYYRNFSTSLCEGATVMFDGYMIEYGGQLSNKHGTATLFLYNIEAEKSWHSEWLWWFAFATGSTYSNSKLIYYAGGIASLSVTPSHSRASNQFTYVHVEIVAKIFQLPLYCSKGSYLISDYECTYCPQGSYASEIGDNNCTLCPPGTYNNKIGSTSKRQCYPCPEGYYNRGPGQKKCYTCPKMNYCPMGSIEPSASKPKYLEQSIQPKSFELQSSNFNIYNSFIVFAAISFSCLTFVLLLIPIVRKRLQIIDVFSTIHKNEINYPLIPRKTTIGGLFFLFFICISCVILGLNIIRYVLLNIEENKTLQPISVFQNDVGQFNTDFNVTTIFHYYGGNCYNDTYDFISIETSGIKGNNIIKIIEKIGSNCKLNFICKNCEISSENKITFKSIEENCFTKAISINISSISSIPESFSIMTKAIESKKNQTFIGEIPSEFAYSFTPSVFYSSLSNFPSSIKGYHLTEYSLPVYGSTYKVEELIQVSGLSVNILINQRNVGLFTERYQKQSFFVLISAVIGLISGIFSIIAFTMILSENIFDRINKRVESNHKVEELLRKRQRLNPFSDECDYYGIKLPSSLSRF